MRRIGGIVFMGVLVLVCRVATGATWYVDGSVSQTGDGTSWATAFKTVQEGIDASVSGDTVIVEEGIYLENVNFNGKNITLTSTDPLDPTVVGSTILDGGGGGAVVTFLGTEGTTCVLSGFTIRNGSAAQGGGIRGGTSGQRTQAVIEHNIITRNSSNVGGGLVFCGGAIRNNTISLNVADLGAGLSGCHGTIESNVITANSAYFQGGGLRSCNGNIQNNTIVGNRASEAGGGLMDCSATVRNCIVWDNRALFGGQILSSNEPTYSCIQDWEGGGEGNISEDPFFVNACMGDYHLRSWSPCVDAGDPTADFSQEPPPNGGRVNMGAYGNTLEAVSASEDTDEDLLPDDWERLFFGDLAEEAAGDPDGDGVSNFEEYRNGTSPIWSGPWHVDGSVALSGDGTSWETAFQTIQEGISAAASGETVIVAEGTYVENLVFPATSSDRETIFEEDFESYMNLYTSEDVVNDGWEVVNGGGDPNGAWRLWSTTGEYLGEQDPNLAGVAGNYMIADSDLAPDVAVDEELITPAINCVGWFNVQLEFKKNYRVYAGHPDHQQIAEVNIRVLNEGTGTWGDWEHVRLWNVSMVSDIDSSPVQQSLAERADGKTIQIRWHFYQAEFDYWFAIDDVRISGQPMQAKNITLTSTDPLDPDVVANTVIDGNEQGSVVRLSGWEGESCVLEGFTIRNGGPGQDLLGYGGGIWGGDPYMGSRTHATIRNNVITGNDTYRGGGLANCDGPILNNTISRNYAGRGGGLIYCHGRIENNVISENESDGEGTAGLHGCDGLIRNNAITGNMAYDEGTGGLEGCDGVIQNNIISGNWSDDETGGLAGCGGIIENNVITGNSSSGEGAGGLSWCNGTIRNNVIAGNSAREDGGGLARCGGTIENNTIAGNRASESGGGMYRCQGTILNCIIWGNSAPQGSQLYDSSEPTYSCVQCASGGGEGNTAAYPHFVDLEGGDYHLMSWSPCIDMGDPSSDFSKEPAPNGARVNMGVYGNTAEAASKSADADGDNLPDDWELAWFPNLDLDGSADPDGDGIPNASEYRHGWNPTVSAAAQVENLTKGLSYETIQDALCESEDGNEIVVSPGVYEENISFEGKNVVLRSTYPTDASVIANTIIDGGQKGPVVAFLGTEDSTCVLAGFTIRNGKAGYGGGILGGTTNSPTQATIRNNVITGNVAMGEGGGLYCCSGLLQNNTVFRNQAWLGGAISRCDEGTIRDCIIWGNIAATGEQLLYSVEPTYCCIEYWSGGGEGNTTGYPHFVDAEAGDYRLESWSPCVDAGDPSSDFSYEPEPSGGRVNMGAYGNTSEATAKSEDTDGDNLPDDWELYWLASLGTDGDSDPDEDAIPNGRELLYGWDPGTLAENVVENVTQGEWYEAIQPALGESANGDEIVVYPGIYVENVFFMGKNVVLRSTDPSEADVVADTIIDAMGFGSVVTFSGSEDATCVLSGFTIRNGRAVNGGGICGVWSQEATIENNVVTGNEASGEYGRGGGLYQCNGTIRNNTISGNSATVGGGLDQCGVVQNNIIRDNSARRYGGGLGRCNVVIENNIIAGNEADEGGGGLYNCDVHIRNNLIVGNSTEGYGGGLIYCDRVLNNTICGNSAMHGGGLYVCSGTIVNCIVWGNTATEGEQFLYGDDPTYSCIQDWTGGGEGNIAADPIFVDAESGNYRLQVDSPCVDAGVNADWMNGAKDLDGNGRILFGGYSLTVDMGAYEYESAFFVAGISRTGEGRIQLTWESRPGTSYKIRACLDLLSDFWIDLATIPSQGVTTTWTDPALPMAGKLFYRIEIP